VAVFFQAIISHSYSFLFVNRSILLTNVFPLFYSDDLGKQNKDGAATISVMTLSLVTFGMFAISEFEGKVKNSKHALCLPHFCFENLAC
jgi:hypothetical protein